MSTSLSDQIQELIATTLKLPAASISESSSMENTDTWDSLAHVNLMMGIEQTFDIEIDIEDFLDLDSVAAMRDYLQARTAG